ncbi:unnamed protein product [Ixodes pacificus]
MRRNLCQARNHSCLLHEHRETASLPMVPSRACCKRNEARLCRLLVLCTVAASNESPACLSFYLEELRRILCCWIQTTVCTPLPVALSLFYRYSLRNEGAVAALYLRSSEFDATVARGSLPSFIGVCLLVLQVSFLLNELCQGFLVASLLSNDWEVRIDTNDGFGNSLGTPNYLGIDTDKVRTAGRRFSCPAFSVSFLTSTVIQRLVQLERAACWRPSVEKMHPAVIILSVTSLCPIGYFSLAE